MGRLNLKEKLKTKHDKREEIKKREEAEKNTEEETKKRKELEKSVRAQLRIEIDDETRNKELTDLKKEEERVKNKIKSFKLSYDQKDDLIVKLIIMVRDHRTIMKQLVDAVDVDIINACEND